MVLLPPNWEEKISSTHNKPYYINTVTQKRQWNIPSAETEETKQKIKEFYDKIGTTKNLLAPYKIFMQSLRTLIIKIFGKEVRSVLDVGCGTGNDAKKWTCEYVGLDNNENMLNIFKERFQNECILADMTDDNTWFKMKRKFDCITCFDALQYASSDKESLRSCIRGMRKNLHDEGFLFLMFIDEEYPNKNIIEYSRKFGKIYMKKHNDTEEYPEWCLPLNVLIFELESADFKIEINTNLSSLASYLGIQTPLETMIQYNNSSTLYEVMKPCTQIDGECWHFCSSYRFIIAKPKLNKKTINEIHDFSLSFWNT